MQLNAYLIFDGQCEAAFKFYEQCLGGKIEAISRYGETPAAESVPPEGRDRILHARLVVGDAVLMGSDSPPEQPEVPQGFYVSIGVDNTEDAERIFKALAENGTVRMPIGPTFWAALFGMLVDRFGIPWLVNCDLPA